MPRRSALCWSTRRCCNAKVAAGQEMRKLGKISGLFEFTLLMLLGILWGIPYALTKISLVTIPPITMVAARVSLAAIALWIVVFTLKCKLLERRDVIPRLF